jgi:hypothetical protein
MVSIALLAALSCCKREEPAPAAPVFLPAVIVRFEASSTSVLFGELVTLSWRTERAEEIRIELEGLGLLWSSKDVDGVLESPPIERDSVFVLSARGEDGAVVVQKKNISLIADPSEVAILQFSASPLAITEGQSTTLSFEVANATRVRIKAGEVEIFSSTDSTASTTAAPLESTTYVLIAEGPGGPKSQPANVVVGREPLVNQRGPACEDAPRGARVEWFEEAEGAIPRPLIPPTTSFFGSGAGLADMNGDQRIDLIVPSRGDAVTVLHSLGDLRFEEAQARAGIDTRAPAAGVSLGDIDNDGDSDLLLLGIRQSFLYENTGRAFQRVPSALLDVQQPAESALLADLDLDGRLEILLNIFGRDLMGGDEEKRRDRLLAVSPALELSELTDSAGITEHGQTWVSSLFDFNHDGLLDVFLANDTFSQDYGVGVRFDTALVPDVLLRNRGNRPTLRFEDVADNYGFLLPHSSMGALTADFDGDGILDLYISNLGKNPLYLGQEDGPFVDRSEEMGVAAIRRIHPLCADLDPDCLLTSWGAVLEDFDNDGVAELLVANGGLSNDRPQPPLLFVRGENGVYEERDPGIGCFDGRALLPADLDDDGDLDLVVIARNEPVRVFRAKAPPENGWLRVKLAGRSSNRAGIGAVVRVVLEDETQLVRAIGAGGVVHSSLPAEAHFGLGAKAITSLTVHWPSGQVETHPAPQKNRALVLEEPE